MTENSATNPMGWGVGLSAILGGALGYWAGRSTSPGANGFGYPYGMPYVAGMMANQATTDATTSAVTAIGATQNCKTCYQEGLESGQTAASLDYIKERANANHNEINTAFMTLQNQVANQTAALEAQFNALKDQKIADQAAEIAALRTQNVVGMNAAATNAALDSISQRLNSIVTNCGVRSYACNACSGCGCSNQ